MLSRASATLLASLVLIAGGCGSSGDDPKPARTTPAVPADSLNKLPKAAEPSGPPPSFSSASRAAQEQYLTAVFHDAQALWQREFAAGGLDYSDARLVLFSRAVHSTGCGAQADVGPFYCGDNHTIYLDLRFFDMLVTRFGVGGFAPAYINAHEFGHHVQTLLGIAQAVRAADRQDPGGRSARSVALELQADCLAGVWAHSVYTRGQLTDEDLNQALEAARIAGNDFQARMAGRTVDSSLWTHGSSADRQHWLKVGFETGSPGACDTFSSSGRG
jgi:uncharacterized protein